ncbi:hypothetical protein EQV77_17960 [Halobacillus fulvus]|nr:hypothetical protein EQV77_17960 [Halobacillus fulvus]
MHILDVIQDKELTVDILKVVSQLVYEDEEIYTREDTVKDLLEILESRGMIQEGMEIGSRNEKAEGMCTNTSGI